MPLLLGLDIGTTSTIGILIDGEGRTLATASRPSELNSPKAGWAEEDAQAWWSNCCAIVRELLAMTGAQANEIAAVGATGMVPAVLLLDEAGNPLRPAILQNDARATAEIEAMTRQFDAADFFTRTGGSINQQLVAPKLRWVAAHEPDVFRRIASVCGSYDFIVRRLTGQASLEQNWALESGFMDFARGTLDTRLIAAGGIAPSQLPPLRQPHHVVGRVAANAAAATGLAAGTPVVAGCADHVVSAFVAGAANDGDLVLKFGGAGDILLSTRTPLTDPRLFIDFHIIPGLYFSNGCMAASGSLLNWIVRQFAGGELDNANAAGLSIHAWLDHLAADVPAGAEGLVLLPYVLGEKTPLHDPYARGTLVGFGLNHTLAHIWRAALEGVIFGFRHHTEIFTERGAAVTRVLACDGGAASDLWLQIAADAIGRPVQRVANHPGSSLGAAYVAGVGVGVFNDYSGIAKYTAGGRIFEPNPRVMQIYDRGYANFRDLYARMKTLYPRLDPAATEAV